MKRTILSFSFILAAMLAHAQLTLEGCQHSAQTNYPLVRQYGLIEKAREYNLENAGKGYLPQFTLSGKATYQSDVTKLPVDIPGIDMKSMPKDQYQVMLEVSQNIWDGGDIRSKKQLTRATSELVSPVKPLFIILAKAVPYFVLSFVNLTTILLLSVHVLDVPVAGSLFWLIVVSLLFIFVSLALGLLISSVTRTQVAAMLASGLILMMPTMLLSGMIFPIESMPLLLQGISAVLPARWYIQAVRKLMIEGVDISLVLTEVSILAVMAVALITVSFKKFKNLLE